MKRQDVHSVKIYFVQPIDLINVFINTMVEMEYETYIIDQYDREKLLKILPRELRNIVFLCVSNKHEAPRWLDYIEKLKRLEETTILIGAFAYTSMDPEIKKRFLYNLVTVTTFANLRENTVEVFKKIFQAFDAKGNRKYIRVKPRDLSEAFIVIPSQKDPIKGKVIDISAAAFACEIDPLHHEHFDQPGMFVHDLLLNIKGIRIRTAAQLVGYSRANKNILIFKYYGTELKDGKIVLSETVPQEVKQKIHRYITSCLREDLKEKLAAVEMRDRNGTVAAQKQNETGGEESATEEKEIDDKKAWSS